MKIQFISASVIGENLAETAELLPLNSTARITCKLEDTGGEQLTETLIMLVNLPSGELAVMQFDADQFQAEYVKALNLEWVKPTPEQAGSISGSGGQFSKGTMTDLKNLEAENYEQGMMDLPNKEDYLLVITKQGPYIVEASSYLEYKGGMAFFDESDNQIGWMKMEEFVGVVYLENTRIQEGELKLKMDRPSIAVIQALFTKLPSGIEPPMKADVVGDWVKEVSSSFLKSYKPEPGLEEDFFTKPCQSGYRYVRKDEQRLPTDQELFIKGGLGSVFIRAI